MIALTFLTDNGVNFLPGKFLFSPDISGVRPNVFTFPVVVINEACRSPGIVHRSGRGVVTSYQLGLFTHFGVILVSVVVFIAFLCPSRVHIFVSLLVGIVVPQLVSLASLYLPVLLRRVALARRNDKAGVDNLSLVYNQSEAVKVRVKVLEELVIGTLVGQVLAIFPYGACVRNISKSTNLEILYNGLPIADNDCITIRAQTATESVRSCDILPISSFCVSHFDAKNIKSAKYANISLSPNRLIYRTSLKIY